MRRSFRRVVVPALAVALAVTGCAGAGGGGTAGGGDANSISVLMVNNPQMVDLQQLTAANFTAETGITVNFTVLPENELRDNVSQEFSQQAGQYDVATLSSFEIPIYAGNGWVAPMDDYVAADPEFDQVDILAPMAESLSVDGQVYGQPFYGESSFLMYRRDVFEQAGITVSPQPTWQEVDAWARRLDEVQPGMAGICLRGQPGWGQVFAPLTTVVNTFGGTWFTEDWQAQVNSPEFVAATQFYVDLVTQVGEDGAAQAGFTECLTAMQQSGAAMWYDATSAAGSLETADSPVRGLMGYAPAPVVETDSSGWLYSWAWGIQQASQKKDAAWQFISWASSKEYEQLVGTELGWSRLPAGKRTSTYEIPEYVAEAGAFAEPTRAAIEAADPTDPGVQPRPAPGIQFVGIPEFPALGTSVSQEVSAAIAGQTTVQDALNRGQQLAEEVAAGYRE